MNDLLASLSASLGSQYRVERELGGGGMSRVFLVEERALARRVVLKVLPPELGAVLSPDRFLREVRVSASLQHPHIVPVLSAGTADGILYYTMPFVEGESLRARLEREHELPVSDVIHLLHQLADALGYAHQRGIVHRDIKPDNVLMSHGHAMITDFGIAKAVTEAGQDASITGTGMTVGTPSYMAPEQASGEPNIDQRADLYSLGAMAYELLSGEPPFRGPTAQAIIAGHLSRTPASITEARPSVPLPLAAIITRCMEKRPADRFQRAEELRSALVSMEPPRTPPVPGSGSQPVSTESSWSMPAVLGYYGIASAVTLAAGWGLRTLLGLPDWFFPAVVVLLAIGLPILGYATRLHNRRIAGELTPGEYPAMHPKRALTMRRAILGGVVAFGTLGLLTAAYMAMRVMGIGPVGTLVASGKLTERERLIIADFGNATRDPTLGPAVTQAFRVDFSQSRLVSPVEADYVRRVLLRMQQPDSGTLTPKLAREIALRSGWKAVVTGDLTQVGPSIVVSAQLVSAESGEVLATAKETAADSTAILDAVDGVSKRLRERIGESLRTIRGNQPLADVTTPSLEALRKYSQAVRAELRGDDRAVRDLLEEAVAADTGFAMAWRKLGIALLNAGEQNERAVQAVTRAFRLRHHLTFREQKLAENSYYSDVAGQPDSAAAALRAILAEYPTDTWAINNLGVISSFLGDLNGSEAAYARVVALEPENALSTRNLMYVRIGLGKFDSATATVAGLKQRFPPSAANSEAELNLLLGTRNFGTAEAEIRRQMDQYRSDPRYHLKLRRYLAGVLTVQGKLAEARRTLDAVARDFETQGSQGQALHERLRIPAPQYLYLDDAPAARKLLDEAMAAVPIDRLPSREKPLSRVVQAQVALGNASGAEAALRVFEENPGDIPGRALGFVRQYGKALVLSIRQETLAAAIQAFRDMPMTCPYCVYGGLADAFDRMKQPDSALVYYQRWADAGENNWSPLVYGIDQPLNWFRMAELYQNAGNRERAAIYYQKFIDNWRDADPALQGKVREARRRLAEVAGEPKG